MMVLIMPVIKSVESCCYRNDQWFARSLDLRLVVVFLFLKVWKSRKICWSTII